MTIDLNNSCVLYSY